LVRLDADETGRMLTADGITMRLSAPDEGGYLTSVIDDPAEANLVLELDAGLRAGYRGFYSCRA
jgi:hypothetical protein